MPAVSKYRFIGKNKMKRRKRRRMNETNNLEIGFISWTVNGLVYNECSNAVCIDQRQSSKKKKKKKIS